MDLDDLDIYNDLDTFQQEEEKKSAELLSLESKYNDSLKTIEALQAENADLRKKIKRIGINFQNLLDTAKAEIQRKDKQIEQLRKERDDICFRRKQPRQEHADIVSASQEINNWDKSEALAFPPKRYKAECKDKKEHEAIRELVNSENKDAVKTSSYHRAEARDALRPREGYQKYARRDERLERKREGDINRDQERRHQSKRDQYESTRNRARSRERQKCIRNSTREYSRTHNGREAEWLRREERQGKQKRSKSREKIEKDSYSGKSDDRGRRLNSYDKTSHRLRNDKEDKLKLNNIEDSGERCSGRKKTEDTNKKPQETDDRALETTFDKVNNPTKDVTARNENEQDIEMGPTLEIASDRHHKKSKDIKNSNENTTLCENILTSKAENITSQNTLSKEKLCALERETEKTPIGMTTPKKAALFDKLFGSTPTNTESVNCSLLSNVMGLINSSSSISTSSSNYTDISEQNSPDAQTNLQKSNIDECFMPIKGVERKPPTVGDSILPVIDITELDDVHIPGLGRTPVKVDLTMEQKTKKEFVGDSGCTKSIQKENKTHTTDVMTTSMKNVSDTVKQNENPVLIELLSDEDDFIEIENAVQNNDTTNVKKVACDKVDFQELSTVQPNVNGEIKILSNVRLPNIYEIRAQQRRLREEASKNFSDMKTTIVKDAILNSSTTGAKEDKEKEIRTNAAAKAFKSSTENVKGADNTQPRDAKNAFSDSQLVENVVMDKTVGANCDKVKEDIRDSQMNSVKEFEEKNVEEKSIKNFFSSMVTDLPDVKPLDSNKINDSLVDSEPETESVTEKSSNDTIIKFAPRETEQKDSICDTPVDSLQIANTKESDIQSTNKIEVNKVEEKPDCQSVFKKCEHSNITLNETKDSEQMKQGRKRKAEMQIIKAKDTIFAFDKLHPNRPSLQKNSEISENIKSRLQNDLPVRSVREKKGKVQVTKQLKNIKEVEKIDDNTKSNMDSEDKNCESAGVSANISEVTSGVEANVISPKEVAIGMKNALECSLDNGSLQKVLNEATSVVQKESAQRECMNEQKIMNKYTIAEKQKVLQEVKVVEEQKAIQEDGALLKQKIIHEEKAVHEQKIILEQKAIEKQTSFQKMVNETKTVHPQETVLDRKMLHEQKLAHEQKDPLLDFQEMKLERKVDSKENIIDAQKDFSNEIFGDTEIVDMQKLADAQCSKVIDNEKSSNSDTIRTDIGVSLVTHLAVEEDMSKATMIGHIGEILNDNNTNLVPLTEFGAQVKSFVENNKPPVGVEKASPVDDSNSQVKIKTAEKQHITVKSADKELEDAVTNLLKSMNEEENNYTEETKAEFSLQYEKPILKPEHKPVEVDLNKNNCEVVDTASGKNSKTKGKELSKNTKLPAERCALVDSMKRDEILWKFKIPKISAKRKRDNCEEVTNVKSGTALDGETSKYSVTNSALIGDKADGRTKRSKKISKKEEIHAIKQNLILTDEEIGFVEINAIFEGELIDTRLLNGRTPEEAQALSAEKAKSERIIREIDNWARRKVGDETDIIESVLLLDEATTKVDKEEAFHSSEKLEFINIEDGRKLVSSSKEVQRKPEEIDVNIRNINLPPQQHEQREGEDENLLTKKAAEMPENLGGEPSHSPRKRFKYDQTNDKRVTDTLEKRKTDEYESKLQQISASKSKMNMKEKLQCLIEIQKSRKSQAAEESRCSQKSNAIKVQRDGKYKIEAVANEQASYSEERPSRGSQIGDEKDSNAAATNAAQNKKDSANNGEGLKAAGDDENAFVDVAAQNQLKVELSGDWERKTNDQASSAQIQKQKKGDKRVANESKNIESVQQERPSKAALFTTKEADATRLKEVVPHDNQTQHSKFFSEEKLTESQKLQREKGKNAVVGENRTTKDSKIKLAKEAEAIERQEMRAKLQVVDQKNKNAHKTPNSSKEKEVPLAVADSSNSLTLSSNLIAKHSEMVESNTSPGADNTNAKFPKRRRSNVITDNEFEAVPKSRSRKRCKLRIEDSEEEMEKEGAALSTEFSTTSQPEQKPSDLPQNSDILDILQNDKANETNGVFPAPLTPTSLPANISQDEQYRELDSRLEQMFASPKVADKTAATAAQVQTIPKLSTEIAVIRQASPLLCAQAAEESPSSQFPTTVAETPSTSNATPAIDFNVSDTFLSDISSDSLQMSSINVTIDETDQSATQMMNCSLSDSNASTKHISIGSSDYRFEKVSDNVVNLFITRKRRGKRNSIPTT